MSGIENRLFAFVDPKDPFLAAEIAGELRPGPVLSVMGARPARSLVLFFTPSMRNNAERTRQEVEARYPECLVSARELRVSDPKDYSALMGQLAREVRLILRYEPAARNFVCVSSGTAEMRAAWFLLTASGLLPATLLQIGSPAEPLFGADKVKEVRLDAADWKTLRDLVMPMAFFQPAPEAADDSSACRLPTSGYDAFRSDREFLRRVADEPVSQLDDALNELGIFIGSAMMRQAAESAAIAADSDLPVLLLGETGTGKELFARLIHRLSGRRDEPMIAVNCSSIPKELAESHLFGHTKGAFTGATADQDGKFQMADGGTLFLDEIGELRLESQGKLLRVLQDGVVEKVGSNKPPSVDVRIVAATNRDLAQEIAAGRFRKDLYFRLEVVQIRLPSLRERQAEIPQLAVALLKKINQRRQHPRRLSKEALKRLERHTWPGNVRELDNVLQRSVLYSREEVLEPDDLLITEPEKKPDCLTSLPTPAPGFSLDEFLCQIRKQLILRALAMSGGNQSAAAELLGVTKQAVSKFVRGQNDNSG